MQLPLISVTIPAYNHEKYIQETIKSIINQTYPNLELIIIDDGSTDSTWQKTEEMRELCEKRFTKTVFLQQENQGTCETLNKLCQLTQGEYIFDIASDDALKPNAISTLYEFLSQNPDYALAVGDNEIIDENSKICYWDNNRNIVYDKTNAKFSTFGNFLKKQRNFDFESDKFGSYETLYTGNYIPNGYLIRKSIFEKTGYFTKEAPLEDWWLMLQISKYAKFKYINQILYSYRWHSTNTIKNNEKMLAYTLKTMKHEINLCKKKLETENLPIVENILKNGIIKKRKGIKNFLEKIKYVKGYKLYTAIKLFNFTIYEKNKNLY